MYPGPGAGGAHGDYEHLTHDELRRLRRKRGYARNGSKTHPSTVDAVERKRVRDIEDTMGTSEDIPAMQEKRRRVEDFHNTFVADKEVVKDHAQRRDPGMKG